MIKLKPEVMEEFFSKKQLIKVGIFSLFLGLIFAIISYIFIINTMKAIASTEDKGASAVSQGVCMSSLRGVSDLGIRPEGKDIIVLYSKGLENASLRLGEASVASLVCPGWKLSSFCMGESCENGEGLLFELQIID